MTRRSALAGLIEWTAEKAFAELAKPERIGLCFCITEKALEKEYGGDPGNIPCPDYPHLLLLDRPSGNYIVVRVGLGQDWEGSKYFAEAELIRNHHGA